MNKKIGLVISSYERPDHLSETLQSLKRSDLHDVPIIIVDDASQSESVGEILKHFTEEVPNVQIISNDRNKGVWGILRQGWDLLKEQGCELLCNLDSDAIVKSHWLDELLDLYGKLEAKRLKSIITGFNTINHPITATEDLYHRKTSIGGINMLFNIETYDELIRPCLIDTTWDWRVVNESKIMGYVLACTNPSVIQHTGSVTTMPDGRPFDRADDFDETIIASFSTIPSRINRIWPMLRSIMRQTRAPNLICLNVPEYSTREECSYIIPDELENEKRILINKGGKDWGPATKLIPTLEIAEDESIIITVDDDNVYQPTMIEDLIRWGRKYPKCAIGYTGHILRKEPYRHPNFDYIFTSKIDDPQNVHVLEGYLGVLYRKSFFDETVTDYKGYSESAFFVDDDWVSGVLDKKGITRMVIPSNGAHHDKIHFQNMDNGLNDSGENIIHQETLLVQFRKQGLFQPITEVSKIQPTICLNMIIKNDAHSLRNSLPTVKPYIDYYVIGLDNENEDDSEEVIKELLDGVPGEVIKLPWKGWGQTRTDALRAADGTADFCLLMDADTQFSGLKKSSLSQSVDSYKIMNINGNIRYLIPRLVKADGSWKYVGRTHEYITTSKPNARENVELDGTWVKHLNTGSNRVVKGKRDEDLLLRDLEDDPKNPRTLFYLGQTYEEMQDFPAAILYYQRRVEEGGWFQEKWQAQFRIAKIHIKARSPWNLAEEELLKTYRLNPQRAEPLFLLGEHYYRNNQHNLAFKYFKEAAEKQLPTDFLFRDEFVNQKALEHLAVSAYYAGEYAIGAAASMRAFNGKKTQWSKDRLISNMMFYVDKLWPDLKKK